VVVVADVVSVVFGEEIGATDVQDETLAGDVDEAEGEYQSKR